MTAVTYLVTVKNGGPGSPTSVTLEDPLSTYFNFQSVTATSGTATYNSALHKVEWTTGSLNSGSNATMLVTVVLNVSFSQPTLIKNQVSITKIMGVSDPVPGNNSSTVGVTVQ